MKWLSSSYVLSIWAKAFQTSFCKYFSFGIRKYCTVLYDKRRRHFSLTDVCFGFVFFKHKCSIYLMPKEKTGSRSPSNNKLCPILIFGFLEYLFTELCVGFITFLWTTFQHFIKGSAAVLLPPRPLSINDLSVLSFEKRTNKMRILEFIQ